MPPLPAIRPRSLLRLDSLLGPSPSSLCLPLLEVGSKVLSLDISWEASALCHRLTSSHSAERPMSQHFLCHSSHGVLAGPQQEPPFACSPADGPRASRATNDVCSKQVSSPATRASHVIQVAIKLCRIQKSSCLSTLTQLSVLVVGNARAQPMLTPKVISSRTGLSKAVGKLRRRAEELVHWIIALFQGTQIRFS